jgi:hypothetical protein
MKLISVESDVHQRSVIQGAEFGQVRSDPEPTQHLAINRVSYRFGSHRTGAGKGLCSAAVLPMDSAAATRFPRR